MKILHFSDTISIFQYHHASIRSAASISREQDFYSAWNQVIERCKDCGRISDPRRRSFHTPRPSNRAIHMALPGFNADRFDRSAVVVVAGNHENSPHSAAPTRYSNRIDCALSAGCTRPFNYRSSGLPSGLSIFIVCPIVRWPKSLQAAVESIAFRPQRRPTSWSRTCAWGGKDRYEMGVFQRTALPDIEASSTSTILTISLWPLSSRCESG